MRRRKQIVLLSFWMLIFAACGTKQDALPKTPGASEQEKAQPSGKADEEAFAEAAKGEIFLKKQGKIRVSYTGNRSGALYITDKSQLPNEEAFSAYDDTYFENHALVLVWETLQSGSIDVAIASVRVEDGTAFVTLERKTAGKGNYYTNDMATWLIWAEVQSGLEGCRFVVTNPAMGSSKEPM